MNLPIHRTRLLLRTCCCILLHLIQFKVLCVGFVDKLCAHPLKPVPFNHPSTTSVGSNAHAVLFGLFRSAELPRMFS
jgi:hypothetical protein